MKLSFTKINAGLMEKTDISITESKTKEGENEGNQRDVHKQTRHVEKTATKGSNEESSSKSKKAGHLEGSSQFHGYRGFSTLIKCSLSSVSRCQMCIENNGN